MRIAKHVGLVAPSMVLVMLGSLGGCYRGTDDRESGELAGSDEGIVGGSGGSETGDMLPGDSSGSTSLDEAEESSTGAPEDPFVEVPAVGIAIDRIYIDQGIEYPVFGDAVVLTMPNITVNGRAARVHATWTLAADFVPRAIVGRLRVTRTDGTSTAIDTPLEISGPAGTDPSLGPVFAWDIPAELVSPGVGVQVELVESVPQSEAPAAPPAANVTPPAPADLGVEAQTRVHKVVVVPIRHQANGCDKVPATDPAAIDALRQTMEQTYPVARVEISVRPEVVFNGTILEEDIGNATLELVASTRSADNPSPDTFYVGLVDACGVESCYGNTGLAYTLQGDPSAVDSAYLRASINRICTTEPHIGRETVVHEVGHNFGREHVACSGQEGQADPNYPHAGGLIQRWGFGIHDRSYRPPTFADYMSYCNNPWVSDYGWERAKLVLDGLAASAGAPEEQHRLLLFGIDEGVPTDGVVVRGALPERSDVTLELIAGGERRTYAGQRVAVTDGRVPYFVVPLPEVDEAGAIDRVDLISSEGRRALPSSWYRSAMRRD